MFEAIGDRCRADREDAAPRAVLHGAIGLLGAAAVQPCRILTIPALPVGEYRANSGAQTNRIQPAPGTRREEGVRIDSRDNIAPQFELCVALFIDPNIVSPD